MGEVKKYMCIKQEEVTGGAMIWMFAPNPNSEKRQPWADMV